MQLQDFFKAVKQAAEYEYGIGAEDQRAVSQSRS